MIFPLLQAPSKYAGQLFQQSSDPRSVGIFFSVLVAFVLLLIAMNFLSQRNSKDKKRNRKYSRSAFKKEGYRIGLEKKQIQLLEGFITPYKVHQPFALLSNTMTLDNTLGKALRDISHMDGMESEKEKRKLMIYRIKQQVEQASGRRNRVQDTKRLKLSQKVTFQLDDQHRYKSVVTANLKDFFGAQIPLDSNGEEIRWKKGTKMDVFIWHPSGDEYSFRTKLLGYASAKGFRSVMLQHTDKINKVHQRKYRRKSLNRPCYIYPIKIVETGYGKRTRREAVVQTKQGRLGTVLDISAGGCAIKSTAPMPRGELLKIDFETFRGQSVMAYGKILDSRKISRANNSMHIMFTRASSTNLNKINDYVYDFE